jgi:hypothetical protein
VLWQGEEPSIGRKIRAMLFDFSVNWKAANYITPVKE